MALQFKVSDMACSACSETITKAIHVVDGAAKVEADPSTKLVSVESQASEAAIRDAITAAGYSVS